MRCRCWQIVNCEDERRIAARKLKYNFKHQRAPHSFMFWNSAEEKHTSNTSIMILSLLHVFKARLCYLRHKTGTMFLDLLSGVARLCIATPEVLPHTLIERLVIERDKYSGHCDCVPSRKPPHPFHMNRAARRTPSVGWSSRDCSSGCPIPSSLRCFMA